MPVPLAERCRLSHQRRRPSDRTSAATPPTTGPTIVPIGVDSEDGADEAELFSDDIDVDAVPTTVESDPVPTTVEAPSAKGSGAEELKRDEVDVPAVEDEGNETVGDVADEVNGEDGAVDDVGDDDGEMAVGCGPLAT